jgi:O-acetyl-ADP-ribose deacetylase (regulator of RNase III)
LETSSDYVNKDVVRIVRGDIAMLDLEAIVNAANTSLLGGGGVDGAIHNRAGPQLLEECRRLGGCRVGEAKITPGFALQAQWIIHTVGHVWKGGVRGEAALLAACYENSLKLAVEHGIRSIAFPAISTRAYAYPAAAAAEIAVGTVRRFLSESDHFEDVVFCCYSGEDVETYKKTMGGKNR